MRLRNATIKATLENTKGKEFEVMGHYWGDGAIRIANPRPEKYPAQFLFTEPDIFDEEDPKRLYWLDSEEADPGTLSPFRIKYMVVQIKPARKRGRIIP